MHLTALHLYPVKSCRGLSVPTADLDDLGLVGDRRFLIVDKTGKFITQRSHPRLALITAALTSDQLTLSASGHDSLTVGRAFLSAEALAKGERPTSVTAPARTISVTIWKSEGLLADDCGDAAAAWLTAFLGQSVRLVRIGEQFHRPVLKKAALPGDRVSFADAAPLLVISEASLAALNDRLQENGGEPVPMDRFRPNVVITGCEPFAEDTWSHVRIGNVVFRSAGKSDRCLMTTTDQLTGERPGPEPLRTLATFRRDPLTDPTAVYFGTNLIHETKRGTLRLGDPVERVDPNALSPTRP
jgi:uncharacterized protein